MRPHRITHSFLLATITLATTFAVAAAPPTIERTDIFPREHKHNHSSCVVETKDGNLLATWYSGSGERKSDDVLIQGAWLRKGETQWEPRFLMADTPGYPDCNPALFAAPDHSLWLFWPTILDHNWEGALLKFAMTGNTPQPPNAPVWTKEGVLHITPKDFPAAMSKAIAALTGDEPKRARKVLDDINNRAGIEIYQRLGWMPRVHVLALPSGRWILPLYSDTYSACIMLYTDDQGKTWITGKPMIGFGNIQASLVLKKDGSLVAFMRDNGSHHRIKTSVSKDEGISWSPVVDTKFPNPGAGVEAIRLKSGRWALIYNDLPRGRHSLAVSVSDDEGVTWKWTRHIEHQEKGPEQFHYPSIVQASDGTIHATYTNGGGPKGSTISHARFSEDWLLGGGKE
jgi:predicted neuraminidase